MRIAVHTPIAASRKEPLAEMTGRIRQAFSDAQLEDPLIRFTFTDAPAKGGSLIDRVLKRHPDMGRSVTEQQLGHVAARMLSNVLTGDPADAGPAPARLAFLAVVNLRDPNHKSPCA